MRGGKRMPRGHVIASIAQGLGLDLASTFEAVKETVRRARLARRSTP